MTRIFCSSLLCKFAYSMRVTHPLWPVPVPRPSDPPFELTGEVGFVIWLVPRCIRVPTRVTTTIHVHLWYALVLLWLWVVDKRLFWMQMVHMLVEDLLQSFPVRLWDIVEESKALAIGRFERIGFFWLSERSRTLTLDGDVAVEVIHVLG